jgi:hypothetical protein
MRRPNVQKSTLKVLFGRYGSRRSRLRRWVVAHGFVNRRRHDRELDKVRAQQAALRRREVDEVKSQIDRYLPRIASGVIEFEREQQAFRLTTFLGDALIREMARYPGDGDAMWEYVGERLGREVTRQLKSLDLGTVVQGPRVLIGDHFIDPWRMGRPLR